VDLISTWLGAKRLALWTAFFGAWASSAKGSASNKTDAIIFFFTGVTLLS
jgi:hypothetical protein